MLNESCPTIELKHQRAHNSLVCEFKTTIFDSDLSVIIKVNLTNKQLIKYEFTVDIYEESRNKRLLDCPC